MFIYKIIEDVRDNDLFDKMERYGRDDWEIFQIKEELEEERGYEDKWSFKVYTLYMKKQI